MPDLGLDPETYDALRTQLSRIIHAAADLRLDASLAEARRTNVEGTRQVLALARATRLAFPHLRILPTEDQLLVYGIGVGGTSTIFTGNALRMDDDLRAIGIAPGDVVLGTVNAGHPGGTLPLPLTEAEAGTLHHDRLPPNLYVADASLLPRSMGNPPSLTMMALALAKRVALRCRKSVAASVASRQG